MSCFKTFLPRLNIRANIYVMSECENANSEFSRGSALNFKKCGYCYIICICKCDPVIGVPYILSLFLQAMIALA